MYVVYCKTSCTLAVFLGGTKTFIWRCHGYIVWYVHVSTTVGSEVERQGKANKSITPKSKVQTATVIHWRLTLSI